ncbi:FAD-dependent oxidoreductase [Sphingomonas lutea]
MGGELRFMTPQPFAGEMLASLRDISSIRHYPAGTFVARVGDPLDRFVVVEEGEIEVVDPYTNERLVPSTLGPGQFMGELSFLNAGSVTLATRAAVDTRTLEAPRAAMLDLMARVPEIGDHVLTVFAARRRMQFEEGRSAIKLIGADADPAIQRIATFLSRNRIPFQSYDLDEKGDEARAACTIAEHKPAVIVGKGHPVDDPTPRKVAALLGLDLSTSDPEQFDLLIVGGGPAGVAAAVYAGSEGLKALVIEDSAIGGQAGTSSRIENYMGFPTGISGTDLIFRGQVQAMKFGTRFAMPRAVRRLEKAGDGFCATLDGGDTLCARAVLVATGVQYRRLPVPRIAEFEGAGVYYAATEMEARFCRETEAVVVGGGNSAGQAAMYLSRFANHVHVVVRGGSLASSMSAYLRSRLEADPRISIHYGAQLAGLEGAQHLSAIRLTTPDGERTLPCSALFLMIGAQPNTGWLSGLVDLDSKGFVKTGAAAGVASDFQTSQPGIFAVGDVRANSVKRVASAVGEGSVVVSAIWSHLDDAAQHAALSVVESLVQQESGR